MHGSTHETVSAQRLKKYLSCFCIFAVSFFGAAYCFSSVLVPKRTDASSDVAVVVNGGGYHINAASASEGTIQLDIASTPTGAIALAKDTLNVKSNAPEGYKVYVAMERDNSCTEDCNSLHKDRGTATESSIPATPGTFDQPRVIGSNSWGFAIDKNALGAPENNFSTGYNTAVPDPSTLWAAMPEKGYDQLIQTVTSPDDIDGVDAEIYYGVKANTTIDPGVYRGTIVYTVVGLSGESSEIADVAPSVTKKLAGNETMTINTLYTFMPDADDISVTIGDSACTSPSLSQNADNNLIITCTSPAHNVGKYDVVVSISGNYEKQATLVNAVEYAVDTEGSLELENAITWSDNGTSFSYPAGYYDAGTFSLPNLGDATPSQVLANTSFSANSGVGQTGTMANYQAQYDSSKSNAQNATDAGVAWNADNSALTVSEGYHVQQEVAAKKPSGNINLGTITSNGAKTGYDVSNYATASFTVSVDKNSLGNPTTVINQAVSNGSATNDRSASWTASANGIISYACLATNSTGSYCRVNLNGSQIAYQTGPIVYFGNTIKVSAGNTIQIISHGVKNDTSNSSCFIFAVFSPYT